MSQARLVIVALAAAAVHLAAAPAWADDGNFRPYVVGARAAGMGGAFTALADDGSGPFFNPGGLAFAERSSLSLSASVYGLASGSQQNVLGPGHDFNYRDVQTYPVATAVVYKWGRAELPDGPAPNAIGVTVLLPNGLLLDDRDTIGAAQNMFFMGQKTQTLWLGLTYARRLGRLGLGASGHVLLDTETSTADATTVTGPTQFGTVTGRSDRSITSFMGALGARYDLTEHWRLGVGVFTPDLGILGSRRYFVRIITSDPNGGTPDITILRREGLHASPSLPWRVQGGVAWTRGPFTLSADLMLLAPRTVTDDADQPQVARRVVRNLVVNPSVGAEAVLWTKFPVRLGFFTDLSASPEPQGYTASQMNPNAENTQHLNRFGGTCSFGYRTRHTQTDVGVMVAHGTGRDVTTSLDLQSTTVAGISQTLTYVFLASTYQF